MRKVLKYIVFFFLGLLLLVTIFWMLGSKVTENLDTYIYNLPFKQGTSHKVVQGYGGWFSHKNIAAIDFSMAEGTPIFAAREGIIFSYKENGQKGGPFSTYKNEANYIIIKHSDGSYGCYWHLQYNGVVAKKGKVEKGQLIGYSGATGFVLAPHLHFTVKNTLNYNMNSFTRTKFNTSAGIQLLKRGTTYERPL
jgi:murein DD-endopeptidase MepM/ murein hydrolase activator NlpD